MKKIKELMARVELHQHLVLGFIIRFLLIVYGVVQDELLNVPFTDVDYRVFMDAGRYVVSGLSPYRRHTFRYSPLIAYLAVPNHFLHPTFGKIIFSLIDILATVLIYKLLEIQTLDKLKRTYYCLFWLYNPLSIVISARGNSDSLSAFLVLLTLYFYKKKCLTTCGLIHGLSVHLRIYPVIYTLPFYLSLKTNKGLLDLLHLCGHRLKFVLSFALSFSFWTLIFYYLYGDEFLNESLLYHLRRVDIRHNYSVYFYLQYLNFELNLNVFNKVCMLCPLLVSLVSIALVCNSDSGLDFSLFAMSFTFVSYNSVLTCQYFVWYLCLLPIVLPYTNVPLRQTLVLTCMWLVAQITWLLPAYLLEFHFKNTFLFIWVQGLVFFISNILLLSALIKGFSSKMKSC